MRPPSCPICGSADILDLIPRVNDHITNDEFQVIRCRECGVSFTWPIPLDMNPYYPPEYRGYSGITEVLLRALYSWRVGTWVRDAHPGDALDVGCGRGLMLDVLRRRGWRVTGVERNDAAAAYARNEFGLEVLAGDICDVPPERHFDLIVLFQVLEHMREPQKVLRECANRLKPGGRLIVGVPNVDSWQARFAGRYWVHLDPPRHLFHFTPASLGAAFERAGLVTSGVRFTSFEHDPFGWVQSCISKVTGRTNLFTRFLMGMEELSPLVVVDVVLASVLALPAVVLAMVSWPAHRGALMEMQATTRGVMPL